MIKRETGGQHWQDLVNAVPGMLAWVNSLEKDGHVIVLTTARKESHRAETERTLKLNGFCWDHLIMGLTNGERVVVNDGPCASIQVKTNGGLTGAAVVVNDGPCSVVELRKNRGLQ